MDQQPLYELKDAGLCTGDRTLLRGANLRLRDRAITVIVGPAGVGKSSLASMLAGRPPAGIAPTGMWRLRGADLCDSLVRAELDVLWSPQRGRSSEPPLQPAALGRDAIEAAHGRLLVLDEPVVRAEDRDAFAKALRRHTESGAAIVVTHDLHFARTIADDVCLVCAGRIEAVCSAAEFFETPPTVLCARFVRMGNCWPAHPAPPLPNHFRWVLPGKLSGMGRPGLLGEEDDDLAAIANAGIGYLVSLTEEPYSPLKLRSVGITARHFPIADMGIPALGPTAHLCRSIQRWMADGERVTVHCHAGLGRTGTILAATLVWLGESADDALANVRTAQPMYVQTIAQRDFVRRFAEAIR
ncbi:hypothetical protein LZC95_33430 [Pendulispora brunnea]|uniref:Tyrosine specific protein phosphatases domain-containing protein n=1 Tax=Pendulispora brunnea TaxID=2905690 RepID=A0ABZ2K1A2_9BACT